MRTEELYIFSLNIPFSAATVTDPTVKDQNHPGWSHKNKTKASAPHPLRTLPSECPNSVETPDFFRGWGSLVRVRSVVIGIQPECGSERPIVNRQVMELGWQEP